MRRAAFSARRGVGEKGQGGEIRQALGCLERRTGEAADDGAEELFGGFAEEEEREEHSEHEAADRRDVCVSERTPLCAP